MDIKKLYSRRCFLWVFVIMSLLAAAFTLSGYLCRLSPLAGYLNDYFIPLVIAAFFISGLILWLILRGSFARLMGALGIEEQPDRSEKKKGHETHLVSAVDKKEMIESNRRFYLHLVSVLQREGRLMDFLAEDLSPYEDAQIGAAVRNIHENCRKVIDKYLKPRAVIDKKEGEPMVVPEGFDSAAIKLTGHVTGEPPFKGVLRHGGWRVGRLELPTLTRGKDYRIIAPAEVEIL